MPTPKLKVITATTDIQTDVPVQEDFFWFKDKKGWHIEWDTFMRVSTDHGFRFHDEQLYQVVGRFIHRRSDNEYYNIMKDLIEQDDESVRQPIRSSFESFIKTNGRFIITRLPEIPDTDILKDTRTTCYKFYTDKFICITAAGVTDLSYDTCEQLIFHDRIMARNYRSGTGGKFIEFLKLACGLEDNLTYIQQIVGYYTHEYNDETMGYMIVLTEQCADPKDGGGSGKNIFAKLLGLVTSYTAKAGSQTKFDEQTFQTWNGERVFAIHDLPKNFDMIYFKDISTSGFVWKKLHVNQKIVSIHDSPKLIFSTNFSYECSDGGLRRRLVPLEFTDFFTRAGGVDTYFGGLHFPNDWNHNDWAGYDNFIIQSIRQWLSGGCKLKPKELSETGRQKQIEFTYGQVIYGFIETYWTEWLEKEFISSADFKIQLDTYYNENSITLNYRPSVKKIHKAIKEYADQYKVKFVPDHQKRINPLEKVKGRLFQKDEATIEELPF